MVSRDVHTIRQERTAWAEFTESKEETVHDGEARNMVWGQPVVSFSTLNSAKTYL